MPGGPQDNFRILSRVLLVASIGLVIAAVSTRVVSSSVYNDPTNTNVFAGLYPTYWANKFSTRCQTCHNNADPNTNGSARNSYGALFEPSPSVTQYTAADFRSFENSDPDADRISTIEEIMLGTSPGLALDVSPLPVPGAAASVVGNSAAKGSSGTLTFTPTLPNANSRLLNLIDGVELTSSPAGVAFGPLTISGGVVSAPFSIDSSATAATSALSYRIKIKGYYCNSGARVSRTSDCSDPNNHDLTDTAGTVPFTVTDVPPAFQVTKVVETLRATYPDRKLIAKAQTTGLPGQGLDTLAFSGADAAKFENVGQDIYLKAGQNLTVNATVVLTVTVGSPTVVDSKTVSFTVLSGNQMPIANNDSGPGFTTNPSTAFTVAPLANDTDPDGDLLSITSIVGPMGQVTINSDSTLSYSPDGKFNNLISGQTATDTFSYTISDNQGGTATATIAITISGSDVPPLVVGDTVSTPFQTPVSIPVTLNDNASTAITAVEVQSTPQHGTVTIAGLAFVYTPEAGFSGGDSFTYIAIAGAARSQAATVSITVAPKAGFVAGSIRNGTQDERLKSLASALDDVCVTLDAPTISLNGAQSQLYSACNRISNDAKKGASIDNPLFAISNEEAFAASDSALDVSKAVSDNLFRRLDNLKAGSSTRGVNFAGLQLGSQIAMGPVPVTRIATDALNKGVNHMLGVSEGDAKTPWGFFLSGQLQFGKRKFGAAAGKRNNDTFALTSGFDYLLSDRIVAGAAVSYSQVSSDFSQASTRHTMNGITYSTYASVNLGMARLDGHLGYADQNFKSARSISFTADSTTFDELANADYRGHDIIVGLRGIAPIVGRGWKIEAIIGVNYFRSTINRYEESGANGFDLIVGKQRTNFTLGDIGLRGSRRFGTATGSIIPRFDFKYHRVEGRDDRHIHAGFVADPLERLAIDLISASDSDKDYYSVALGTAAEVDKATLGLEYSTIFGLSDVQSHQVSVNLGLPF